MKILIVFRSASGHIHRMDEWRSLKAAATRNRAPKILANHFPLLIKLFGL